MFRFLNSLLSDYCLRSQLGRLHEGIYAWNDLGIRRWRTPLRPSHLQILDEGNQYDSGAGGYRN
jgi:hypothetical protein